MLVPTPMPIFWGVERRGCGVGVAVIPAAGMPCEGCKGFNWVGRGLDAKSGWLVGCAGEEVMNVVGCETGGPTTGCCG
jgi:hypothetical protein